MYASGFMRIQSTIYPFCVICTELLVLHVSLAHVLEKGMKDCLHYIVEFLNLPLNIEWAIFYRNFQVKFIRDTCGIHSKYSNAAH